jgi:ketosteroid isomerase-like protein
MAPKDSIVTDEIQIRDSIDDWADALRAKDLDRIMSHYASDVLAFDAISQMQFKGVDSYRKHWEACLSMCSGPSFFEIHDLDITSRDGLAFCHALNRCGGTGEDGQEKVCWMRMTVCYRKIGGDWRVVHEHFSSPFDMQSGKALFELQP